MAFDSSQKAAMQHPNKLGAGAAKRKTLPAAKKIPVVMKEFGRGLLHSGSGAIVKNPKQALAIGYSEAGEKGYKTKPKGTMQKALGI